MIQRPIFLAIEGQFHVLPAHGNTDDPVELGGVQGLTRFAVGEEVYVAIQHDLVLIDIQVGMGDIPEQGAAGIIGSGEVLAVMKEPPSSGIRGEILMRKGAPPPGGILNGLKSCRHERVGIGLLQATAVEGRIAFIL